MRRRTDRGPGASHSHTFRSEGGGRGQREVFLVSSPACSTTAWLDNKIYLTVRPQSGINHICTARLNLSPDNKGDDWRFLNGSNCGRRRLENDCVKTENVLQGNHSSCPVHCIQWSRALHITNNILSRCWLDHPHPPPLPHHSPC